MPKTRYCIEIDSECDGCEKEFAPSLPILNIKGRPAYACPHCGTVTCGDSIKQETVEPTLTPLESWEGVKPGDWLIDIADGREFKVHFLMADKCPVMEEFINGDSHCYEANVDSYSDFARKPSD